MPTGYTALLDDHNMPTKKWIMEGLARAFGMCVALREDNMNLSEEEVKKRIEESGKSDADYHVKELAKAQAEATIIFSRTDIDWEKAWKANEAKKAKHNREDAKEKAEIKQRHERAKRDLEFIIAHTTNETTINIAKYGLDQLKLTEDECEPWVQESVDAMAYKAEVIKNNNRDIRYHTEELAKAKERAKERIDAYLELRADIDRVFHIMEGNQ